MTNVPAMVDHCLKLGILSAQQAEQVAQEAAEQHVSVEELLLEKKIVDDEQLTKMKAAVYHLPLVELQGRDISHDVIISIPEEAADHYHMVAFARDGDELSIGIVDPQNFQAVEAAEFLAKEQGMRLQLYVITLAGFKAAYKTYRAIGREAKEVLVEAKERFDQEKEKEEKGTIQEVIRSAPVSKMVSMILRYGIDNGASDIHIEPSAADTRVRYRVDGDMKVALTLPSYIHSALVSRIKVLASLKLDETRIPQDGRIKYQIGDQEVDFRVSILPLVANEKVVLRVLDTSKGVPTLVQLGFRERFIALINRNISKPHGLFLITGPTGSGKSTTLYTALNMLNTEDVNIVTEEDPVEYHLPGVNQSQINPDVGLTFAAGLRAILRQDPDIIMVGEIRDKETAELAIHAGLTGHIVFSTLHTNDALGAIPRLIDMGVEPFFIVSTLNLVMAQRLVRKICDNCKIEETKDIPKDLLSDIEDNLARTPKSILTETFPEGVKLTFMKGKGCIRCGQSGYKGRTTVAEFIEVSEPLRKIVLAGNKQEDISKELVRQEFITMKQDGILKVLAGVTTIEEVISVTQDN